VGHQVFMNSPPEAFRPSTHHPKVAATPDGYLT